MQAGGSDLTALLRRCATSDYAAFAELYDATSGQALGLALRLLRDDAAAEELVQEVFAEVWHRAGRYDARHGSVGSWILTMVHSHAVDRLRTLGRPAGRHLAHEPVAGADPASAEGRRVQAAMDRLSDAHLQTISLTYFDGYTCAEAATRIGIPTAAASSRLRDALRRLQIELVDPRVA